MCPSITNKFDIYINSADRTGGDVSRATFSFASTGFSTDLSKFVQYHKCYVKLQYFAIDGNASTLTSANTDLHTIRFNIDTSSLPHSFATKAIGTGNSTNLLFSNTIGLIPIFNTSATYLNKDYENEYIVTSNIFAGDSTIALLDQNGTELNLSGRKWTAQLCVYFSDE